MASNSSGKLNPSQTYTLGDYVFRLITTYIPEDNETSVQCNATKGTDHAQSGKDLAGLATITEWRVEAEDRTATAYAKRHYDQPSTSPIIKPFASEPTGYLKTMYDDEYTYSFSTGNGKITFVWYGSTLFDYLFASANDGAVVSRKHNETIVDSYNLNTAYTHSGLNVYYLFGHWSTSGVRYVDELEPKCNEGYAVPRISNDIAARVAWTMIYGDKEDEEFIVSKFPIDIAEAGGGTWDDPGSTGEPSKTLHITATGALSGRHNDPLNDTTYHYTPSDREQADVYGSGGVGGNGGAGGAGASTVIIYNCATDKAGYTEEIAIAKRHGYGSGAGKGGKGGDGCILVYY